MVGESLSEWVSVNVAEAGGCDGPCRVQSLPVQMLADERSSESLGLEGHGHCRNGVRWEETPGSECDLCVP